MSKRRFLKSGRLTRYHILREEHLTYREALDFSRMNKHVPPGGGRKRYPPALIAIVKERRQMWKAFQRESVPAGWGETKVAREWKKRVGALYDSLSRMHKGNFFVVKDVHGKAVPKRISPWALYDAKYDYLPDGQRWDTPRSSRVVLGSTVSFRALNRYKVRELKKDIRFYEDEIKRTGDPDGGFKWKLDGARYQLKTGEY